jgi:hypothetical protein
MSVGRNFKFYMVSLAAVVVSGTAAFADEQSPVVQPAVISQASVTPAVQANLVVAGLEQDGLHQDSRWPLFANCINNTGSPDEFTACLRTAFLADSTGTELALLHSTKVAALGR